MTRVVTWAYGITTVPDRVDNLLPETIKSLADAGFVNPMLFIDGACDIEKLEGFSAVVIRHPKVGNLGNWMGALVNLFVAHPQMDRYALFEDDLIALPRLREYLDSCQYPQNGYWNLLTHDENLVLTGPCHGWHLSNQRGRGAVGLVFNRTAVQTLISAPRFTIPCVMGKTNRADGMVIDALKPMGYTEYVHYPSLIQHVGVKSVMGHSYGTVKGYVKDYDLGAHIPHAITREEAKELT